MVVCPLGLRETVHATVFQVTQERTVKSIQRTAGPAGQCINGGTAIGETETVNVRAQNILWPSLRAC